MELSWREYSAVPLTGRAAACSSRYCREARRGGAGWGADGPRPRAQHPGWASPVPKGVTPFSQQLAGPPWASRLALVMPRELLESTDEQMGKEWQTLLSLNKAPDVKPLITGNVLMGNKSFVKLRSELLSDTQSMVPWLNFQAWALNANGILYWFFFSHFGKIFFSDVALWWGFTEPFYSKNFTRLKNMTLFKFVRHRSLLETGSCS